MSGGLRFPHAPIRHPSRIELGSTLRLDERAREALRFREVQVKEAFTLQDSEGRFFRASLKAPGEALVYEAMDRSPESPLDLTLFCAVLARQRMLLVVPKAVELGATRIVPVLTHHSVGPEGLPHEKAHAWPRQALRAVRQCRRASVPEIREPLPLDEAVAGELWRAAKVRYYLDDRAEEAALLERGPSSVCLITGPEGGWTDPERASMRQAGAVPLVFGGRVLRAETAVIAGLTLLQHQFGDLR